MLKVTSVLFCISCITTALLSNSIIGAGMWFWVILSTGIFVALSSFVPSLNILGALLALLLSVISICGVLFALVAATIGGSFRLDGMEALLLFSFGLIAIFGITVVFLNRRNQLRANQAHQNEG